MTETLIGLTFGQIIAVIGLVIMIIGVWINSQVNLAKLEVKTDQNSKDIQAIKEDNESKRVENKSDHEKILAKIEQSNKEIINKIDSIKRR